MTTHFLILPVAAPRDQVFNFLADVENLPAWTGGFCEWIELHRDGWWAYTALGELEVAVEVDAIAGEIRLGLGHASGRKVVVPLQVRTMADGGAQVSLACAQLPGAADGDPGEFFASLAAGLRGLTGRARPELTAA
jgi:hypothetical protein